MKLKSLLLIFSIATLNACQQTDKHNEFRMDVEEEIADLNSISDKENYLESIFEADQNIRNGADSKILLKYGENSKELRDFRYRMDSIDQLNLVRIDRYLEEFGYPEIDSISEIANTAPWVVVHHSADVEQRRKYFPSFYQAFKENNLDPSQFELYLGRTYQMEYGKYPSWEGHYKPEDKINWLINELNLTIGDN